MTIDFNVGGSDGIFRKFEATNAPKGEGLAKEMMIFADKNAAAVSEEEFQNMLKKMKKLSPRELVNFIRSFDKKESIIELICDEIGNGKKSRRKACEDVFKALLSKAEKLGIETDGFSKEIKDELDAQFTGAAKYVNTKKLDSILNALTQAIENRQDLTAEDIEAIQNTSAEDAHNTTAAILDDQLQGAYAAFGERIDENGEWTNKHEVQVPVLDEDGNPTGKYETKLETYNGQLQQDGWAGDVADFVSKIWNNELWGNEHGNTADLVRKDLRAYHDQLQELQAASAEGEEAFAAKFKEIFGVDYDYKNIVAYQKVEQEYVTASLFNAMETQFNRGFRTLLSKAPLREEYETTIMNTSAGAVTQSILSATKEQVYDREFANLASFFGEDGENILNSRIAQAGLENATIDEKFEVLKQLASEVSSKYHNLATAACDGKDFASVEAKFENSYKAAFGVENDIMERVSKYNRSQQTGAITVKLTAVIAASIGCGYAGAAIAGNAAIAAAAAGSTAAMSASTASTLGGAIGASAMTFLTEAADDLTTTKAYEAWAKGDLKTLNECVDWSGIVKQAATSGIMMVGFGAVAKGVQVLTVGLSPAAQGAAMFGANMAFGTGAEYVMTGKVSIQGVVLTGVFSIVAGVLQFHAANVTKAAEDAIKAQLQQDIANARNVLGIDDSVEITAELLKSMKKDFALQLHPDKFGGQVPTTATGHTMGDINAALDVLNRNLAGTYVDINAGVAAAKAAAASTDDATMALTTTQTVDSGLEKAILSFARSVRGDKQVVASTISKHPDVVNALVSRVAPDGTPMFTNKDIALILANSAEMLEKDKAMFMAVLNSEREMSIVASYDNKAYAFWKATIDPLDETYYAVKGKSSQTSASQAQPQTATSSTGSKPISRETLLSSDNPVDFDTTSLQQWADDMGFTMTIEGKGSKIAIFKDSDGNIVRRMTEDYSRPGKVYDDKIWYYENGRQVAGKTKYHFDDFAWTYEVDASGSTTNLHRVYPPRASATSGKPTAEAQHGYPIEASAKPTAEAQHGYPIEAPAKPAVEQPKFNIVKVKADAGATFSKADIYHLRVDKALAAMDNLGIDAKSSETFLALAKEHPKAMAEVLTYFDDPVKTANAFNKIMKLAENNPEECTKVLQGIGIRLNEIEYRRHTWNLHGLGRSEGYNAYTRLHEEVARLKGIMEDLAAQVVKQSAPSQKLPRYIDNTVADKTIAEAYAFGNGSMAEIHSRDADRAIKELSNYLGKELTPDDVQVISTDEGAVISYFDNETNLSTVTACDGSLNGQYKIIFDAQGNITDYDIYSIYSHSEGKFYLK